MPRNIRPASATDFIIPVEGVGRFTFARRTLALDLAVSAETCRILDGAAPTDWFWKIATMISVLRVLVVNAPDDWDLDALDPLDDDTYVKIQKVYSAVRDKEDSFRRKSKAGSQDASEGALPDGGVLVSQKVQPATD